MTSVVQLLQRSSLAGAMLFCAAMPMAHAQEAEEQPAQAEQGKGFYATAGVGAAWPQDVTGKSTVLDIDVKAEYSLGVGFAGEVGAGYDFGNVRTELTYLYNNASLDRLKVKALGQEITSSVSSGDVNTNSVMVSTYVDIPTKGRFAPYLGGGIGYTNVSWGSYSVSALGTNVKQSAGNQGVFGYQGKLGMSYLASKTTDVFVEATYQGTAGFTVDGVSYDPLSSWGARLGARYRF